MLLGKTDLVIYLASESIEKTDPTGALNNNNANNNINSNNDK